MDRLDSWMRSEVVGFKRGLCFIIIFTFINQGYWLISGNIFYFFGYDLYTPEKNLSFLWQHPFLLILFSFLEEVEFRLIPLLLAVKYLRTFLRVSIVVIIISALFGFMHGGYLYIFVQGVSGILLSIVFLKGGGFQGRYLKALLFCATAHIFTNLISVFVLWPLAGYYRY